MAKRNEPPALPSDAQVEVLNILWDRGKATVGEVWQAFSARRPVARNTVLTLVTRLEEKGWLRRRAEGNALRYSATVPRQTALRQLAPGPGDVVLACREIPADGVRAALDAGRRAGATTILNPAPADDLDVATIALADILTPNETELAILAGGNAGEIPEAAARRLLAHRGAADAHDAEVGAPAAGDAAARRVPAVVVTLGAGGALVVEEGSAGVAVPGSAVHPVDTTGAGDTFNGALAAGLADGLGLLEAVRHAVAAAALSTTRPGARGGMPTRVELERFLGDG